MVEFELELTDEQFEQFARRMYPELKRFFQNEENQKEFETWKAQQNLDDE